MDSRIRHRSRSSAQTYLTNFAFESIMKMKKANPHYQKHSLKWSSHTAIKKNQHIDGLYTSQGDLSWTSQEHESNRNV